MKNRIVFVLIFCLLSLGTIVFSSDIKGKIVGISDGDTVKVLSGKTQYKIRLYGIDAPEKSQDFGNQSKKYLSNLIFQKNVKVVNHGNDRYGRVIGDIEYNGQNINLEMVKAGYAWWYQKYSPNATNIKEAEAQAKNSKLGLWSQPNPIPPWDYRRGKTTSSNNKTESSTKSVQSEKRYWLNTKSNTRHNSSCKYYKNTKYGRMCTENEGKACRKCGG